MATTIRYETLTGPQKASIFMLSLSEDYSSRLFGMLEMDEVRDLSHTIAQLGRVDGETVELLLQEFVVRLRTSSGIAGGFETTERLLSRFLDGERLETIMEEIRGPAGRTVWDKLGNVNDAVLAGFLEGEYPQTTAVVLSKLDPGHAARVLTRLDEARATEVIQRMLGMETVQKEVLADVERTLRATFVSNLAKTSRRDNHEVMAEIFNHFDKPTEGRLLDELDRIDSAAADRVRALMFTFEDLVEIAPQSIQVLIRRTNQQRLAMALKGAPEPFRDVFLQNMSERAARMLVDELRSQGAVRVREVEEARQFLVNLAKELAAAGEIKLESGKEEELIL